MNNNNGGDNIAVLIDADNVPSRIIAGLMTEVANYGTASVRRIYGDWTSPTMKGWRGCLLEHSIVPIQANCLHDRQKRHGRSDDYRCNGLAVHRPLFQLLPRYL